MKRVALLIIAAACSTALLAASPAATQQWVRNYVATNSSASAIVSTDWLAAYLTTSGVIQAAIKAAENPNATASNTVEGVYNQIRMNSLLQMTYTNDALKVMWSPVYTNLNRAVFAPLNGYWTNAVIGASVVTSGVRRIDLRYGSYSPYTTNGIISCFTVYPNGVTSTNGVDFLETYVSDADINAARGN